MRFFTIVFLLVWINHLSIFSQDLRVRDIVFTGNEIIDDEELLAQMNTQPKKSLEKLFFWKKRPDFIASVFDDDINRLTSYYNRNGFLNPDISFNIDTSSSGKLAEIKIMITENDFVKTGDLKITLEGDSITAVLLDSLKPQLPIKTGQRFRDANVFEAELMIKRLLSDRGYPFTRINRTISVSDEETSAGVDLRVDAGERSWFGEVTITGDSLVPEKFIEKYLLFSEGGLYMQRKVDSTQQDLFGTDLFQYVVIAARKDSVQDNRIPMEIVLRELPRWKLEAGAGYGSEDKLRLAAELTKLNFLGGARRLIVNAKTSYFMPFSIDVRFVQPDILIPRLDFVINPFYLREREISYRIDRIGGAARLLYQFRNYLNAHFSYSYERDRILELTDLEADSADLKHNKSIFSLGGEHNTSDDPFYPSKGQRIDGTISLSGLGYSGAVHFYKVELSYVRYFTIAEDVVFATRLHAGILQTTRDNQRTPIEERYYLGGASSLRGWGRHRISPLNESGIQLGGNTMAEGSAELRFPVYELLHGALFVDAGNVWYDSYYYDLGDLRYNAGVGVRLRTPIGPVRLDFATPVINDGFNLQFFISIGHAF